MDFTTTFGSDYLTLNPDIVFGTAMLGRQFGVIKTASVRRTGDREPILNDAGELRLLLIKNPGWEMILTCAFDKTVSPPGLLESITLPFIGVKGHVMEGVSITWEGNSERLISIPVNSWDVMTDAVAYRLDPVAGAQIFIGRAGNPPTNAPTLTLGAVTSSTVTLLIGVIAGAERYRVEWSDDGITWVPAGDTDLNYMTVGGMSPRTTRRYRVRGMDGEAGGPWSAVLIATTAAADAPPAAAPVVTILSLQSSLRFAWTAVTDAEEYEAEWRIETFHPWQPLPVEPDRTAVITGLITDDLRRIRVRAKNSLGNGPWAEKSARLYATPEILAEPQTRNALSWRLRSPTAGLITRVLVRWSLLPDMSQATDVTAFIYHEDLILAGNLFDIPDIPLGVRTYWQAKQSNMTDHQTEWGPISTVLALPRTPTGIALGALSSRHILWANPGGQLDGWRIYKQHLAGALVLHTQSGMSSTLPISTMEIDLLNPWPGDYEKVYVVAVRAGLESPLPAPVTLP